MNSFKLKKKISDECFLLESGVYGTQMWQKCRVRKSHKCSRLDKEIEKGSLAFRPFTNGYNRMCRISLIGMEIIKRD